MPDNYLTVDVEEYFEEAPPEVAARCPSRLEAQMDRLLALLDETGSRATFFFLARRAEAFPSLVRRVASLGHEVACHGLDHVYLYRFQPAERLEQVERALDTVRRAAGGPVVGFRAPYFSLDRSCAEIFPRLAELGVRYDSSLFPGWHPFYGFRGIPSHPFRLEIGGDGGSILELPPTVADLGLFRVGVGSGGYLRMFPFSLTMRALRSIARRRPLVLYFHPWELDPDQPRLRLDMRFPFRHYANLRSTEERLRRILSSFDFRPCRDALERDWPALPLSRLFRTPNPL